jgi:hypothetical protein
MKFLLAPFAPLLFAGLLSAQVSIPEVGLARYADQTIRSIYGVPANFIVGEKLFDRADAVSFSGSGGLVSTNGRVELVTPDGTILGQYDSSETTPLLNIESDLETAVAWLPAHHVLLHWNGQGFSATQVEDAPSGAVTSVQLASPNSAKLLVMDSGKQVFEATISLETGNLISSDVLPGVQGPAFRQHSFVVFHDSQGLEIESPTGDRRTLPLEASDISIERMSSDWLHLYSQATDQHWALHLSRTVLNLSALPAPRPSLTQEIAK